MKRYIILIFVVALMSSCNGDIYDNIKEFVDSETVYPAGYKQTDVSLLSGYERVEIYLMGDNREDNPYMPKAIKTVVKWGEEANEKMEFTPARSWVDVTGLTVAQVYHFQVYTEDEFGNISTPVTISGKPFNDADKGLLVITNVLASANTSQAVITATPAPESYEITGGTYSFTSGGTVHSDTFTGSRLLLEGLPTGEALSVQVTFDLLPIGALDKIPVTYDVDVTTMTALELNDYITSSSPFPATSDGKIGNPYNITKTAPFVVSGAAFDLGGEGKGTHQAEYNWDDYPAYRRLAGDQFAIAGQAQGVSGSNHTDPNLILVGAINSGDWYAYTVNVVDAGIYKLEFTFCANPANADGAAQATLTLDNLDVLGVIPLPKNPSWDFRWVDPQIEISLTAGIHKFRWTCVSALTHDFGGFKLTFVREL